LPAKITGPAAFVRPPSILDLSLVHLRVRFRTSGATLYARNARRLSDPSASPRLSTYSIAPASVPGLFRNHTSPQAQLATQPYGDFNSPQFRPEKAKWNRKFCTITGIWSIYHELDSIFWSAGVAIGRRNFRATRAIEIAQRRGARVISRTLRDQREADETWR